MFRRHEYNSILKQVLKENEIVLLKEQIERKDRTIEELSETVSKISLELESQRKMNDSLRKSIESIQTIT